MNHGIFRQDCTYPISTELWPSYLTIPNCVHTILHLLAMKSLALLGLLSTSCAYAEFVNGPGSRLINGGHTANYQPIEKISEVLIAAQIGENSTALEVLSPNITIEDIGTSRVDERDILKRQDNRPAGALKCGPGAPCIDDSCCGAVSLGFNTLL